MVRWPSGVTRHKEQAEGKSLAVSWGGQVGSWNGRARGREGKNERLGRMMEDETTDR